MRKFYIISFGRLGMTGKPEDRKKPEIPLKEMGRMGALIWFMFVALVIVVLDRETFFP